MQERIVTSHFINYPLTRLEIPLNATILKVDVLKDPPEWGGYEHTLIWVESDKKEERKETFDFFFVMDNVPFEEEKDVYMCYLDTVIERREEGNLIYHIYFKENIGEEDGY